MIQRRTPLKRGAPPKRKTPLKRSTKPIPRKRKKPRRTNRVVDRALLDEIKAKPCVACGQKPGDRFNPIDPSHITSRGAGGDDTRDNVAPMCRIHHDEWHRSSVSFTRNHPGFQSWLIEHHRLDILSRAGIEPPHPEKGDECSHQS